MDGPATSPRTRGQEARSASKVWLGLGRAPQPDTEESAPRTTIWRELGSLALLLLLAGGIRAWLLCHTEVAARDSIGFIRYALELERYPWKGVLQHSLQHPGYPVVLLAVSWPVRAFLGSTDYFSMQLSAQLASALAGVLLVIPMYYLGRDLFDRRAGFWGAALFQCLPVSARVMSDALSEATFLLFTSAALLLAVRALRGHSALPFALCGLFSGFAYLTRPEGALLVGATGLVLLGMQCSCKWRRSWRRVFVCGSALILAAAVVGSPYVFIIGRLTNKPTPRVLLETARLEETSAHGANGTSPFAGASGLCGRQRRMHKPEAPAKDGQDLDCSVKVSQIAVPLPRSLVCRLSQSPFVASLWAIYCPEELTDRRLWGLYAIATEVTKDFQYVLVLPLVIGLGWFCGRLKAVCGAWVVVALCALHALLLWRLAVVVGYVSDRHVLVLLLCGVFTAAAGVLILGERLPAFAQRLFGGLKAGSWLAAENRWLSIGLLLTLIIFGLQEALKPLHANRAGHRQAGLWLAENTIPADPVMDPYCWAHYYAGRVFTEGITPPRPTGYVPTQYVVLEQRSNTEHSRLPTIHQAKALAARGKAVYHWPVEKAEAEAKIVVYAVPP